MIRLNCQLKITQENRRKEIYSEEKKTIFQDLIKFQVIFRNMSIGQVKVINTMLYQRFAAEDNKDFALGHEFEKSSIGTREKSPRETLKRLIKKGLVYYVKPFLRRPQSSVSGKKENYYSSLTHQSLKTTPKNQNSSLFNRTYTSPSSFTCSRNHQTGRRNNSVTFRVKTQLVQSPSKYFFKKQNKDQNQFESSFTAFRQFRNISEKTLNRMKQQHSIKNFKINEFKRVKYDFVWRKHPIIDKLSPKHVTTFHSTLQK